MGFCRESVCGCRFVSTTLDITQIGGVVTLEQAEFTDLAGALADIAALEAAMTTAQADIAALETDMGTAEAAIARFDAMTGSSASSNTGTTSGTTALTIVTTTTPTLAATGLILMEGRVVFSKTVSTDVFQLAGRINAVSAATAGRDTSGAAAGWCTAFAGPTSVAGGSTPTLDIQLSRVSGTGTATLRWWFLPS
jgi:hypothetical protein